MDSSRQTSAKRSKDEDRKYSKVVSDHQLPNSSRSSSSGNSKSSSRYSLAAAASASVLPSDKYNSRSENSPFSVEFEGFSLATKESKRRHNAPFATVSSKATASGTSRYPKFEDVQHPYSDVAFATASGNARHSTHIRHSRPNASSAKSTETRLSAAFTQKETFGVILLGNSGAGKSFLLNTLIGHDTFASRISAVSVTRDVGIATEIFDDASGVSYDVKLLDIPGLIESSQEEIDRNKQKIYEAFRIQPLSIVGFVFHVFGNGRLNNDDVIAFNAIMKAYDLETKMTSVCFIINGIPKRSRPAYKGEIIMQLEKLTGVRGVSQCFLKDIDQDNAKEREELRTELIVGLLRCNAINHKRRHNIELEADKIDELKQQLKVLNVQWEKELTRMQGEAENRQQQHAKETEVLRKKLEQAQQDSVRAEDFKRELQKIKSQMQQNKIRDQEEKEELVKSNRKELEERDRLSQRALEEGIRKCRKEESHEIQELRDQLRRSEQQHESRENFYQSQLEKLEAGKSKKSSDCVVQ